MLDASWVNTLLWTLAVAGTVYCYAPPLLTWLGLYRVRCTAASDPQAVVPAAGDADYEAKYQDLLDLGFRPVGVLTEHYWLFAIHWYKPFRIRCLAMPGGTCIAGLYRMAAEPMRIKMDTFLSNNFLVRTAMPGLGAEDMDKHWARFEEPAVDVAELYARHQGHMQRLLLTGRSVAPATFRDLARIAEHQEKERFRRSGGQFVFLGLPALFHLLPALVVLLIGFLIWGAAGLARAAAIALCVGSALHIGFVEILLPLAINAGLGNVDAAPAGDAGLKGGHHA
jgi:hypothetical protein